VPYAQDQHTIVIYAVADDVRVHNGHLAQAGAGDRSAAVRKIDEAISNRDQARRNLWAACGLNLPM
jgi:hypothetical protein